MTINKTPIQQVLSSTIDTIGNRGLDELQEMCRDAQDADYYFIPIVLVAAVKDGTPPQLLASTCMFGRNQPQDGIARLLRVTAQHLSGGTADDGSESELHVGRRDS